MGSITPPGSLNSAGHRVVEVAFEKLDAFAEDGVGVAAKGPHFSDVDIVFVLDGSVGKLLFFGVSEGVGAADERDEGVFVILEVIGFVELLQCLLEFGGEAHFGVGVGIELRLGDFVVALGIFGFELAGGRRLLLALHELHGLDLPHHLLELEVGADCRLHTHAAGFAGD